MYVQSTFVSRINTEYKYENITCGSSIDGLMYKRRYSIANTLELRLLIYTVKSLI